MDKKPISQLKAWLLLYKVWKEKKNWMMINGYLNVKIFKDGSWCPGLCLSTGQLQDRGVITRTTEAAMDARIYRVKQQAEASPGFVWTQDVAGAKARAAFCLKEANRLRKANKKKTGARRGSKQTTRSGRRVAVAGKSVARSKAQQRRAQPASRSRGRGVRA